LGSLFEHPFGRVHVGSDSHFAQLIVYIHRNPQQHGFVDDFRRWPHSSYRTVISLQPTHLQRDQVLAWFSGGEGYQLTHLQDAAPDVIAPLVVDD